MTHLSPFNKLKVFLSDFDITPRDISRRMTRECVRKTILKDIIALVMYWRGRPGRGWDGYIFLAAYDGGKSLWIQTLWEIAWANQTWGHLAGHKRATLTAAELKMNEAHAPSCTNANVNLLAKKTTQLEILCLHGSSFMSLIYTGKSWDEGNFLETCEENISIHTAGEP